VPYIGVGVRVIFEAAEGLRQRGLLKGAEGGSYRKLHVLNLPDLSPAHSPKPSAASPSDPPLPPGAGSHGWYGTQGARGARGP
jgi:hypothetical protein